MLILASRLRLTTVASSSIPTDGPLATSSIYPFEIVLPIEGSLNYIDYYSILSYEDINSVSKFYFSGTLEPLQLAAKFNYYDKILSIRGNWINTVDLKFK